jgi:sodium/bile acid cotransporter 7
LARLSALRPDPYVVGILAAVAVAAVLPVHGALVAPFGLFTKVVIGILFVLYGARLSREAVVAGILHWRLHALALTVTFVFFPLVAVISGHMLDGVFASPLILTGLLYMCCLPSTIQSSVAFVASARGNVAAAVCTASMSNLIGVIVSPLLVAALLSTQGAHVSLGAVQGVVVQILLPFIAGQLLYPQLGGWAARNRTLLSYFDRGSIMLLVYGAFSAAVVGGVWKQVGWSDLGLAAVFDATLLAVVLYTLARVARALGFVVADEVVVLFCGSQKGITVGVSMASLIFPAPQVGLILVPLMIYHQFQLIACAALAQRYARRPQP